MANFGFGKYEYVFDEEDLNLKLSVLLNESNFSFISDI